MEEYMKDINILERLAKETMIVGKHIYIKEDECVYVAKRDNAGELKIFQITKESLEKNVHLVKEPTQEQYENALLNYILDDDRNNPAKRGIYSMGVGKLYYEFLDALSDIKFGKIEDVDLINRFALNNEDVVLNKLAKTIVDGYKLEDEKLLTK